MRWTCPKCGKKLTVSDEQLIAQNGVIVCPQCLCTAEQPLPKRPEPKREAKPAQADTVQQRRQPRKSPPPYKGAATVSARQATPAVARRTATPRTATATMTPRAAYKPRSKTMSKNKKNKKPSRPMSGLGCLWRSILVTLALLIAYILFGLLLRF